MSSSSTADWHSLTIRIPFFTSRHAHICLMVFEADPELQAQFVKRTAEIDGSDLIVTFTCRTVRLTRLTINSFFEKLDIFLRITKEFGLDAEDPDPAYAGVCEGRGGAGGDSQGGEGGGREGGGREGGGG
ncbi:transcription factor Pcc1 [Pyrrhoderma noxium]|uniref:Transcription factor Pcc1 n=1 Tax=Pyrrhoderma noxium TaxID=2282107 RepID=A0A286UAC1_9AGAM|nr:transcription factor Pcc1 [Pyrrhoderma noxium]